MHGDSQQLTCTDNFMKRGQTVFTAQRYARAVHMPVSVDSVLLSVCPSKSVLYQNVSKPRVTRRKPHDSPVVFRRHRYQRNCSGSPRKKDAIRSCKLTSTILNLTSRPMLLYQKWCKIGT